METKAAEKLVEAIKKAGKTTATLVTGKVIAVDTELYTCDIEPTADAADIFDVRLRAAIINDNEDGLILVPKIGSEVVVAKINTSQFIMIASTELELLKIQIGVQKMVLDKNGFVFNDGNLEGMVKINELVDKLNKIENKVNSLINHYNTHNHAHPQGPTTGLLVQFSGGGLTLTQKIDLENIKIKQ